MHFLNKTLALTLTFSLLAQNALFAAPLRALPAHTPDIPSYTRFDGNEADRPLHTLAQYQARAKQDRERTPWIKREGKTILAAGGTAAGLMIVQQILHNRRVNNLRRESIAAIRAARRNGAAALEEARAGWNAERTQMMQAAEENEELLRQAVRQERAQRQALEQRLRKQQIKVDGLSQSVATQRQKLQNQITASAEREQKLLDELAQVKQKLRVKSEHFLDVAHYSTSVESALQRYDKLFLKQTSAAERQALKTQLVREKWLMDLPKAHRQNFLEIVDRMIAKAESGVSNEVMATFLRIEARNTAVQSCPLFEYLIGMSRRVFKAGNMGVLLLFVLVGATAYDARSQELADRVNGNFDLFIDATPQQLAEMEKNEDLRKICINGAEALHLMTLLSEEEQTLLNETLALQTPDPVQTILRKNRAY